MTTSPPQNVTDLGTVLSGTVQIDGSSAGFYRVGLGASLTFNVANVRPGQSVWILVNQTGAANFAITWTGQTNELAAPQPGLTGQTLYEIVGSKADESAVVTALYNAQAAPSTLFQGTIFLYFMGDSITSGQSLLAGQTWPVIVASRVRGGTTYDVNAGVPADTLTQMIARYSSGSAPPNAAASFNPLVQCWFILDGGFNDLNNGGTAAAAFALAQQLLALAKATGYKTAVLPIMPSTALTAGKETNRVALNVLYALNTTADLFININQLAETQVPSNASYFPDGIHPSFSLNLIIGEYAARMVNQFVGYLEPPASVLTSLHQLGYDSCTEIRADQVTLAAGRVASAIDQNLTLAHNWSGGDSFAAGGAKPHYITDDGDGLPAIDFQSATLDALVTNGVFFNAAGPFHVMMYVKIAGAATQSMWNQAPTAPLGNTVLQFDNSVPPFITWTQGYDSGSPSSWAVGDPDASVRTPPKANTTSWHWIELINDGRRLRIIVDDTECSNNIQNSASIATTRKALGAQWFPGFGIFNAADMKLRHYSEQADVLPWYKRRDARNFVLAQWSPRFVQQVTDVALVANAFTDLFTLTTARTASGHLKARFQVSATTLVAGSVFQILMDGVVIGQCGLGIGQLSTSCEVLVAATEGTHTIKVQYKAGAGGTLQIRPSTQSESASLSVDPNA